MKTFKTTQHVIIVLLILFFTSCEHKIEDNGKLFDPANCPRYYAESIPNEFIIKFDECKYSKDTARLNRILEKLEDMGINSQDTCSCDSTLIRFFDSNPNSIDPEEREEDINDRLRTEGDVFGVGIYNLAIKIDDQPKDEFKKIKSYTGIKLPKLMKVAVIDGGINSDGSLRPYMWENDNRYGGEEYGFDLYEAEAANTGHGSFVSARIIEGIDTSTIKLIDIRVFDEYGNGNLFDATCGMSFAIKNDADIINTSWGYYNKKHDREFFEFVKKSSYNDIIIVSSAGNNQLSTDICSHFPSGFDEKKYHHDAANVISVAYLNDAEGSLNEKSNYGKKTVSLAANGIIKEGGSIIADGSSYAAPKVTRAVAIIKSTMQEYTHRQVIQCLLKHHVQNIGIEVASKGKLKEIIDCEVCAEDTTIRNVN